MWTLIEPVREFNTGRRYAADGQRIVWAVFGRDDPYQRVVVFFDLARGIDGCIDLHVGNLDLIDHRWVLRAYDDHHYRYNNEAFEALRRALRSGS
jgi:hypothetical protein